MVEQTKQVVCVVFGGASSEYEVSCSSAASVLENIERKKYDTVTVGITKTGRWLLYRGDSASIRDGSWVNNPANLPCAILPDRGLRALAVFGGKGEGSIEYIQIDCVFPVLHGKNGEDGTIQGLFELAGLPYVGCGVLSSAVAMDKSFTKIIVNTLGIAQADYIAFRRFEYDASPDEFIAESEKKLGYPVFVKPANAGSSVGISKASNREELVEAIASAFKHDRKLLIEEAVIGHEIETAALGNFSPLISCVGEVLPSREFYSYESKYLDGTSLLVIPAKFSDEKTNEIRDAAKRIFVALDGRGLSRIDFFVRSRDGEVVFNEINTLPGFTDISMYAKLFNEVGIPFGELTSRLIALAMEEYKDKTTIQ